MTATALVTELGTLAETIQDQATNENSPHRGKSFLDEASQGMTREELFTQAAQMRRELIAAVRTLPDGAFEPQPADANGNQVWSAGEVITHCNAVLMRFAERGAALASGDTLEWPKELAASGEQRVLDKDATIAAAELINLDDWFARIPRRCRSRELRRFTKPSAKSPAASGSISWPSTKPTTSNNSKNSAPPTANPYNYPAQLDVFLPSPCIWERGRG